MKTVKQARALLRRVDRHWEWRLQKQCRFVFGPVKEAMACLDRPAATAADRRLLATGYAYLGDVFDFIGAPHAAVNAYRSAVRLDPSDRWSWRELGSVLDSLGQYGAALRAVDTAIRLGDDDWWAGFLRETIMEGGAPRYANGREGWRPFPSWDAAELLARNRPHAVLALLRGKRHPYLRQIRARAYGALGDVDSFLKEWEGLRGTRGGVEIEIADWFFEPPGVSDMPRFWHALWAIRHRSVPGYGATHDALWRIVPEPKRYKSQSKAALRRHRRRERLILGYHLARTERDAARARRLARRYPDWPEAVALDRELSRGT